MFGTMTTPLSMLIIGALIANMDFKKLFQVSSVLCYSHKANYITSSSTDSDEDIRNY